jgi:NhaC family Na+:H+ antiporter
MKENKVSERNIYLILILTLISIISCIIFKIFLFYGFLASIAAASFILIKSGFSITEILNMIKKGNAECISLFILVALIGAMISIWMTSGVVPTMLFYGLKYMQGTNFLFAAFILTSIVAIFMGTAIGTVSSVGIALLGLAKVFGIPEYLLMGAIVSGAFIADKISPISSLFNLTLESVQVGSKKTLISMLKTFLPTYFLTALIYYLAGKRYTAVLVNFSIDNFTTAINRSFVISPFVLLLPLCIIIMSFLGVKMVKAVALTLIAGIAVSIGLQKGNFYAVIAAVFNGYKAVTDSAVLNTVLVSGGVRSMIDILLIIAGAISLSSIFQESGLIIPIINRLTGNIKTKEGLIIKTGLISCIMTLISDETIGIILPGKLLSYKYNELGIENTTLARTIADTGTIISPLIPWNVNSIFIVITTGIPTLAYGPYSVLCYLSPIVTVIFAYGSRLFTRKQVRELESSRI